MRLSVCKMFIVILAHMNKKVISKYCQDNIFIGLKQNKRGEADDQTWYISKNIEKIENENIRNKQLYFLIIIMGWWYV